MSCLVNISMLTRPDVDGALMLSPFTWMMCILATDRMAAMLEPHIVNLGSLRKFSAFDSKRNRLAPNTAVFRRVAK